MMAIFLTANRLLKHAYFRQRPKYNKEYFINEILEGSNQECNQGTGYRVRKTMTIHMDDRRVDHERKHCKQLPE
jgi:hypothetical protein